MATAYGLVNGSTGAAIDLSTTALPCGLALAAPASTGAPRRSFTATVPAHTLLTAGAEHVSFWYNDQGVTQQFATGAIATQRFKVLTAPTYSFVAASTITTAATWAITGAPVAGTNATITNSYALWIQSGNVCFAGSGTNINGVNYVWPGSQGGASTVLQNDGSGNLSWAAAGGSISSAVILAPAASTRNVIVPATADIDSLVIETAFTGPYTGKHIRIRTYTPTDLFTISYYGEVTCTPYAYSGGATSLAVTHPGHSGMSAELHAFKLLQGATQTFSADVTTQRGFYVSAPAYAMSSTHTITTAATFAVGGAPTAGSNCTITNSYSLWVQDGTSKFDGDVWCAKSIKSSSPSADVTANGTIESDVVGEGVAFGDLLYMKSDGKWWKASNAAASTMPGLRMALATASADASCSMLISGRARNDSWSLTVGGIVYVGASGAITQTAPSTTGYQIQIVGVAYAATKITFMPCPVMAEVL